MLRTIHLGLLAAAVFAGLGVSALAAPLSEEARTFIEDTLFRARLMSNAEAALKCCREAQQSAAKYDPDPFYDGAIAKCIAQAERNLISQSKHAACFHYGHALEGLQAVPADHPRYSEAKDGMDHIRRDLVELGC